MGQIQPGEYVRVPIVEPDEKEGLSDFRSYRLAQVVSIDQDAGTLNGLVYRHPLGAPFAQDAVSPLIENVQRCRIYPGSPCVETSKGDEGVVLAPVFNNFTPGIPQTYYVSINGTVRKLAECALIVPGDAQDPDPRIQMRRYELQEPGWRSLRDPVVEAMADLQSATYGLEELIGSRVLLLPHQAEVVTRALGAHDCRFILADEVGLGKTIEAAVILKGLRRRNQSLRPLIVAPASLTGQWKNELRSKFWMNMEVFGQQTRDLQSDEGVIIAAEDLAASQSIQTAVLNESWDCLIIDEAHHIRKQAALKTLLIAISRRATAVLVLSATPIEQRGGEYLELLRLMDPLRYCSLEDGTFQQLLDAQAAIRSSIEYIRPTLTPSLFDGDEFLEELRNLVELLPDDILLRSSLERSEAEGEVTLDRALDILSHVNTNYRVEDRVLRNRRAHLETELPARTLETRWAYHPLDTEHEALEAILDYGEALLAEDQSGISLEYVRLLIHAASSSPHAVEALLSLRLSSISKKAPHSLASTDDLLVTRNQRDEPARITGVIDAVAPIAGELSQLQSVMRLVNHWNQSATREMATTSLRGLGAQQSTSTRFVSVLQAIHKLTQQTHGSLGKVIVFSSWSATLDVIGEQLKRIYGARYFTQFRAGMDEAELEQAADTFQADRSCQVLLTDELGGEGRNFQIADAIIHVDLPWSPARIEQRIGRVDRLGRRGNVISIVPYARGTIEEDLFSIWSSVFQLFNQSMSGLEIALEEVQTELVSSLATSVRHGLSRLKPTLDQRINEVRQQVERERYFEEGAINQRKRSEFQHIRDKYRDGRILERAVLSWAHHAGLKHDYDRSSGITTFFPKHFNSKSMENANILTLPDMDEAIRRAGRRFTQSIRGTFSRDLAISREDLVFFAPGDDPWFDWIVQNAERADRGRCCAIFRRSPYVTRPWKGLEVLYRIEVDPRPLYEIGASEAHLVKAQGYLNFPTYRIYVSESGEILSSTSEFARATSVPYKHGTCKDVHFGKRSGNKSPLAQFKQNYPVDVWQELTESLFNIADCAIREEFSFMEELAQEARSEMEDALRTAHAIRDWQYDHLQLQLNDHEEITDQAIVDALVEGIARPRIRLESACYWWIAKA